MSAFYRSQNLPKFIKQVVKFILNSRSDWLRGLCPSPLSVPPPRQPRPWSPGSRWEQVTPSSCSHLCTFTRTCPQTRTHTQGDRHVQSSGSSFLGRAFHPGEPSPWGSPFCRSLCPGRTGPWKRLEPGLENPDSPQVYQSALPHADITVCDVPTPQ